MQIATFDITQATEDEVWAIWRGELQVEMTPEDESRFHQYVGAELYAHHLACEAEAELAQYRATLGYDSGVDEQRCLEAFIQIYEENSMAFIEKEFPYFLETIKETYLAARGEQSLEDVLADFWDFMFAPEPHREPQDLDALWDQIAAAHAQPTPPAPEVNVVWIKQPAYSEVKPKISKKISAWDFSGYAWHQTESPKYQLVM